MSKVAAKKPPVVMQITGNKRKHIQDLVTQLKPLLPATSRVRQGRSLQRIAIDTRTSLYFIDKKNKEKTYQHYLFEIFRRHKQKPKTIVLKILSEGAASMANKSRVLSDETKGKVADIMEALGFQMRDEIMAISQPPFRKISYPKDNLRFLYDELRMHSKLQGKVKDMYFEGNSNEAVRYAMELFELHVQSISEQPGLIGINLMQTVFDENVPLIKVSRDESDEEKRSQRGFKRLCMGYMGFIRNQLSHGDADTIDFLAAFKMLAFVSYLLEVMDEANNEGVDE